jgi:hypothetical protein
VGVGFEPTVTSLRRRFSSLSRCLLTSEVFVADRLRVIEYVVKQPPTGCATLELFDLDVGDTVSGEHSCNPEVEIMLRIARVAPSPDGADPRRCSHTAQFAIGLMSYSRGVPQPQQPAATTDGAQQSENNRNGRG